MRSPDVVRRIAHHAPRLALLFVLALLALQATFVVRVAAMVWIDPGSTSFQRSEMWRLATTLGRPSWAHRWVDAERMSRHLSRAVLAAEDAGFAEHSGVEWDAIERAWERNQREVARYEKATSPDAPKRPAAAARTRPRLVGGSTITQQLAKNLFLAGERTAWRKGQELVVTYALEALLDKRRILEIYLNHVEWGEGVFGAQMAARHYHRVDASALTRVQAARLAVMLPAPKRFEKRPDSPYLLARAAKIDAGMDAVELP
jgi:monofunctional biosynthetic peptidoglycan transglycosylase